jgi:hypothetical protein
MLLITTPNARTWPPSITEDCRGPTAFLLPATKTLNRD